MCSSWGRVTEIWALVLSLRSDLWDAVAAGCCPANALGWLQAASSARCKQCLLESCPCRMHPPGILVCSQRMPGQALLGVSIWRRGQPPWFPGCPCALPSAPSPAMGAREIPVVLRGPGMHWQGGASVRGERGSPSAGILLGRHWGSLLHGRSRKALLWAVISFNCNGKHPPGASSSLCGRGRGELGVRQPELSLACLGVHPP